MERRVCYKLLLPWLLPPALVVSCTAITPPTMDKLKQWSAGPQGQKAGGMFKKAETGIWKVLEPVGKLSNNIAGRVGAESFWPVELADGEIEKAARILRTFTLQGVKADDDPRAEATGGVVGGIPRTDEGAKQSNDKYDHRKTQKVIKKIPAKALQGAVGIAIFTCFRTGFGLSGAGGSGVVLGKLPDGSWGPPSGILIHTIAYGFLIGIDIYDVVLIIRTPKALQAFEKPKIAIGAELSIAAGPVGNGATLDSGLEASPCWSYTKSKGAYAGVQLDGTIILKRDDANARFYGHQISVPDILAGKVKAPSGATPLLQTLYAAEGRPQVLGTDMIPEGVAPGDTELTEEEKKEFEAHAANIQEPPPASADYSSSSHLPGKPSGHRVPPPLPPSASSHSATASSSQPPPSYDEVAAPPAPPAEKSGF